MNSNTENFITAIWPEAALPSGGLEKWQLEYAHSRLAGAYLFARFISASDVDLLRSAMEQIDARLNLLGDTP